MASACLCSCIAVPLPSSFQCVGITLACHCLPCVLGLPRDFFWPSRPCPFSVTRHSVEAAWEKAIALSKLNDRPFNGPGGRRFNANKEKAGLQRSVMVAFFGARGQEMPR